MQRKVKNVASGKGDQNLHQKKKNNANSSGTQDCYRSGQDNTSPVFANLLALKRRANVPAKRAEFQSNPTGKGETYRRPEIQTT